MVEQPGCLGPEPIHFFGLDGHRLRQSVEYRPRVLMNAIHQELIMQMRAGGASGGTDVGDDFALSYSLSFSHGVARQVGIFSLEAAFMLDYNQVAERTIARCPGDSAITGGAYRSAGRCRIIGAFMGPDGIENGMPPTRIEI